MTNIKSLVFIIPIALLMLYFCNRVLFMTQGYGQIESLCSDLPFGAEDYYTCFHDKSEKLKELDKMNLVYSIAMSVLLIIVGAILFTKNIQNGKLSDTGAGIAIAGVMNVVYNLVKHWNKIKENLKLIVIGCGISALAYGSYRLA